MCSSSPPRCLTQPGRFTAVNAHQPVAAHQGTFASLNGSLQLAPPDPRKRSLVDTHLHLDSDDIPNVLIELPSNVPKRRLASDGSVAKRRKTTGSRHSNLPGAQGYVEDPPGVIRPLTPPLTSRKNITKRSRTHSISLHPNATLPRLPVTKAAASIAVVNDFRHATAKATCDFLVQSVPVRDHGDIVVPTYSTSVPERDVVHITEEARTSESTKKVEDSRCAPLVAPTKILQSSVSRKSDETLNGVARDELSNDEDCNDGATANQRRPGSWYYHPDLGLVLDETYPSNSECCATSTAPLEVPGKDDVRSAFDDDAQDLDDEDLISLLPGTNCQSKAIPAPVSTRGRRSEIRQTSDRNTEQSPSSDPYGFTDDENNELLQIPMDESPIATVTNAPISTLQGSGSFSRHSPLQSPGTSPGPKESCSAYAQSESAVVEQSLDENYLSDEAFIDIDAHLPEPGPIANTPVPTLPETSAKDDTMPNNNESVETPIVRVAFPESARDRSPVTGISPSTVLRTCFRIGEALNIGCNAARLGRSVVIELYASVQSSIRDAKAGSQYFQLADMFRPDYPPVVTAVFTAWKGVELWDRESAVFLGEGGRDKLCRCLGRMKKENGKKWIFDMQGIWEASWDDVRHVEGIVTA